MSLRRKHWLLGIGAAVLIAIVAVFVAAIIMARRFEPMVREQAMRYMRERFHADVQIGALHIVPPKVSAFNIVLRHGRGAMVPVEMDSVSMRFNQALPPLFTIQKLNFTMDLGTLFDKRKTVQFVSINGIDITIPPSGQRPDFDAAGDSSQPLDVLIQQARIRDALLVLLPKDPAKKPLSFEIANLELRAVERGSAMKYDAALTIPMPPGTLQTNGNFGPWDASEPAGTPFDGEYKFENADLGVFKTIAGTLASTGTFQGTLGAVDARGEATVPNFRLRSAGQPVPLTTRFEVTVDGINGNTVLKPVRARLGRTNFTTTGAVIQHERGGRRAINLQVSMPAGNLGDLLRLAQKGVPFMQGVITLKASLGIPPLSGPVKDKLRLAGTFQISDGKFLRSTVQDQIDQLSRRGQGQPKNWDIDNVFANMAGAFQLENQIMAFRSLSFAVPGAQVALTGNYNLTEDTVDFHGALKLQAKLSQTMSGWKRWALRPVDPFFAKNGAGTFLRIRIEGSAQKPKFGLDRSKQGGEAAAIGRQKSSPLPPSAQNRSASR